MTPSAPSEPSARPSRSGPAADAGGEPSSSTPDGVASVRPATRSAKRPTPVDACPAELAAQRQRGGGLLSAARPDDGVRGVGGVAPPPAQQVQVALATGVPQP